MNSALPSAVSDSLRVVRCNKRTFSSDSTAAIRALTADFETPSLTAARVKDFSSTTRAKNTIERISSGDAGMAFHSATGSQRKRGLPLTAADRASCHAPLAKPCLTYPSGLSRQAPGRVTLPRCP